MSRGLRISRPTLGTKGTPAAIVSRLNLAAGEAMDSKVVQDRVHELGATLVSADRRSPEYLQMLVEREIAKWGPLIKAAGISVD
jgi:tripartite-type tricarboxylate transporter receptor subunit TctC